MLLAGRSTAALLAISFVKGSWAQWLDPESGQCDNDIDDDTLPLCGCQNKWMMLHEYTNWRISDKGVDPPGDLSTYLTIAQCNEACCKNDLCYGLKWQENMSNRGVLQKECKLFLDPEDPSDDYKRFHEGGARKVVEKPEITKLQYHIKKSADYVANWESCQEVGEETCLLNMKAYMYPYAFFDDCMQRPDGDYDRSEAFITFEEFVVPFDKCFPAFGYNSKITCLPDGPDGMYPGSNMLHWVKYSTPDCEPGTETVTIDHGNGFTDYRSCHPGLVPSYFFVDWGGWCSNEIPPAPPTEPEGSSVDQDGSSDAAESSSVQEFWYPSAQECPDGASFCGDGTVFDEGAGMCTASAVVPEEICGTIGGKFKKTKKGVTEKVENSCACKDWCKSHDDEDYIAFAFTVLKSGGGKCMCMKGNKKSALTMGSKTSLISGFI